MMDMMDRMKKDQRETSSIHITKDECAERDGMREKEEWEGYI